MITTASLLDAPKTETKERQEVECTAMSDGEPLVTIISVQLRHGGLPQN
jgi:hypothetical protein